MGPSFDAGTVKEESSFGALLRSDQAVLPDRSPERALPYDTDPVCEVVAARDF